ncbi:ABC transporter ATP-binding protein [Thiomicrorhabdus chilensis]|uniref:ABC transporter ATP-binding protein n=1 Tax=Thiomicrorhabdus chilensis TaxID=63656 RepID=UPI000415F654|nr:ATP-binding cassette domain-containing protein [Thiomicrorhabdus chilensis]
MVLQVNQLKAKGMRQAVSFSVPAEQLVLLYGVSGTGKSVLMRALADLIVHEGEVLLDGVEQRGLCPENWRRQVMYFSAETAWWRETVEEHFETLPSAETLHKLGLDNDYLKRSVNSLSSGEKQRLALLRGLLYEPRVLLLDEITANLDFDSALDVEKMVLDYSRQHQAGVLWVSHDQAQQKRLADSEWLWDIEDLYAGRPAENSGGVAE